MKVAISAQQGDIESLVDPRFGRAVWFIIADSESGEWTAVDNHETADASGGAGVQAGTMVAEQGVRSVITGNVGPNAHKVLIAAGISIYQAGNGVTVREAIRSLNAQELEEVGAPTVAGHWA
jgi:predicted Fe-Mo cluster-binding NifX family protein